LLCQRNAALKAGAAGGALAAWTAPLLEVGERITAMRQRYVDELAPDVAAMASRLMGREVQIAYHRGWREGTDLGSALEDARERERELGTTPVGPHRGDLRIKVDGAGARDEVSRGQQKLIVAALVLAQVDRLEAEEAGRSVLLVDDPAAELDAGSLERLLAEVHQRPAQLVMMAESLEASGPAPGVARLHVERGQVRAVE
jgi:DNA replication and repair protein RecF